MPHHHREPYTLDRIVRLVIAVCIVAALVWLINRLRDVLLPFGVACLVAYIFEPFVQFNRKLLHLRGRIAAIFVTLFEVTFFAGVLAWICVPMIINECRQMAGMLEAYTQNGLQVPYIPDSVHEFIRHNLQVERLSDLVRNINWTSALEDLVSAVWSFVTGSISLIIGLVGWFIVVLYVVFIMIDYDRLTLMMRRLVPPKMRPVAFRIGSDLKNSMNSYFRGQALIAFLVGVLFSVGFLIVGLPLAVVMGLFIGLLNMVPYLQLVSIVPVTLLCLVNCAGTGAPFWPFYIEVIAVYCVVQLIQDLYLTPRIMGKAMGLNPALILLSLSVWGSLMGAMGLIIALPLTTLLLSYYNRYVIEGHDISDDPDDPAGPDSPDSPNPPSPDDPTPYGL